MRCLDLRTQLKTTALSRFGQWSYHGREASGPGVWVQGTKTNRLRPEQGSWKCVCSRDLYCEAFEIPWLLVYYLHLLTFKHLPRDHCYRQPISNSILIPTVLKTCYHLVELQTCRAIASMGRERRDSTVKGLCWTRDTEADGWLALTLRAEQNSTLDSRWQLTPSLGFFTQAIDSFTVFSWMHNSG